MLSVLSKMAARNCIFVKCFFEKTQKSAPLQLNFECSGVFWLNLVTLARESALYEREVWTQREEQSRSIAIENGTKVVELSAEEKKRFQNAVYGVYEKYCGDDMGLIEEILKEGS